VSSECCAAAASALCFYFCLFSFSYVFDAFIDFLSFLQIVYVDSLLVDNVVIPSTTPRVAAWSKQLLDQVIKLDTKLDGSFGNLKVCIK
jgi:hypothetical protein